MTSLFDRIPYEVLDRIIQYAISSDKKGVYAFQLVNKQWNSVVEKYIYKVFALDKIRYLKDNSGTVRSYETLLGQRRSKYVKTLCVQFKDLPSDDDGEKIPLNDNFFKVFPNINEVYRKDTAEDSADYIEYWEYFRNNFTSKRCELKSLGEISIMGDSDELDVLPDCYAAVIIEHARTLEKVIFPEVYGLEDSFIQAINEAFVSFPNLTSLAVDISYDSLKDLDDLISKCPKLEYLSVSFQHIHGDSRIQDYLSNEQHDHPMQQVQVRHFKGSGLPSVHNYLVAKFPVVEEWSIMMDDEEELILEFPLSLADEVVAVYFDLIKNNLGLIAEAKKVTLGLQMYCTNTADALDFLFCNFNQSGLWEVSIDYCNDLYDDETSDDETLDGEFDLTVAAMRIAYSNLPGLPRDRARSVEIKFLTNSLHHIEVLERVGHRIESLKLYNVPLVDRALGEKRNDILSHILDTCPKLESLEYSVHDYENHENTEFVSATPVHNNLKKMTFEGYIANKEKFLDLSVRAPNLTVFDVYFGEGAEDDEGCSTRKSKQEIVVNMPHNCFEKLTLNYLTNVNGSSLFFHATTVKLVLLEEKITERYYVQLSTEFKLSSIRECDSEEEYDKYRTMQDSINITVICKSIQHFQCEDMGLAEGLTLTKDKLAPPFRHSYVTRTNT